MRLLCLQEILTASAVLDDGTPVVIGPAFENDNHRMSQCNTVVSVALARMAGAWVVSAFKMGADGEPDTDNGEIFVRTFERETMARWLYRSCVSKLKAEGA